MGTRALNNRVKKIKELERQKAELEKAIEELKAEIKAEMESKDVKELYNEYLKAAVSKRFSIA